MFSEKTIYNYADTRIFSAKNLDLSFLQLDSVIGRRGGEGFFTIHFVESGLMLAFLRDANGSKSVIDIFDKLYLELSSDIFMDLFQIFLTDNGSEFSPKAVPLMS